MSYERAQAKLLESHGAMLKIIAYLAAFAFSLGSLGMIASALGLAQPDLLALDSALRARYCSRA